MCGARLMMPGPASWNLDVNWEVSAYEKISIQCQGKAHLLRDLQERHAVAGSLRWGAHEGSRGPECRELM